MFNFQVQAAVASIVSTTPRRLQGQVISSGVSLSIPPFTPELVETVEQEVVFSQRTQTDGPLVGSRYRR